MSCDSCDSAVKGLQETPVTAVAAKEMFYIDFSVLYSS
jgi:hypothetical protein